MKIIFIVRQSLDIFWIVEYNFNGNQDKKSHRYSEGPAFILKSIDPLKKYLWKYFDLHKLDLNHRNQLFFSIWKSDSDLIHWTTSDLNIESSNFVKYPRVFHNFVIDPSTSEYNCM